MCRITIILCVNSKTENFDKLFILFFRNNKNNSRITYLINSAAVASIIAVIIIRFNPIRPGLFWGAWARGDGGGKCPRPVTPKNAHRLEKAFNFDTVQSTWPPSWISIKVLRNTYEVTDHVQS